VKVKAKIVEEREVEISPEDAFHALKRVVFDSLLLPVDAYLNEKGQLVRDETYHTSHSWEEQVVVLARPTAKMVEVINAFTTINKQLKGIK
jgi:hypothetical protein